MKWRWQRVSTVTDPLSQLLPCQPQRDLAAKRHTLLLYIAVTNTLQLPCLLPDAVVLDGVLVQSGDKYLKTCNALDAMAQAIESFGLLERLSRAGNLLCLHLSWVGKYYQSLSLDNAPM